MSSTPRIASRIVERDDYTCVYCHRSVDDPQVELSVDHVVPLASFERGVATGDPDVATNLVTACTRCNSLKRDMDVEVFALYLRRGHGWTTEQARDLKRRVRNALRRKLPE